MSTFMVKDLLDTEQVVEGYIFKVHEDKVLFIIDEAGNNVAAFHGWSSIIEVSR